MVAGFFLSISQQATAQVVVFSNYDTKTYLDDDQLRIERTMRLKNVGTNPIIPGELHFKLKELRGGTTVGPMVDNLEAKSSYGNKLTTTILEYEDETDLVISVWDPLLPGFHFDIDASYEMTFDESGILFHEINVPTEETTIPIRDKSSRFYISDSYKVTYAPGAQVYEEAGYKVVEWGDADDRVFEYTVLPLPKTGIRAVNLFWISIIIILIASFVLARYRRR